ncbi:hypothetical protein ACTU6V_12305 [Microbacterium sp. A204]|uniref:hypothetical protein n=1 Tax=Microbacterium sp. A204 TaxID=3457321 RepID=UPI003FD5B59E
MATWYTTTPPAEVDRLRAAWEDAPVENMEVLGFILETAQEQVIAYAPELAEDAPIPNRWVYAQLQQATNLWNAGTVTSSGDVGVDQYSYTPRPLDKTIKGIIRPIDGKPHVL